MLNRLLGSFAILLSLSGMAFAAPGDLLLTIPNPDPRPWGWFGWSVEPLGSNLIVASGRKVEPFEDGRVFLIDGTTGSVVFEVPPRRGVSGVSDVAAAGGNIAVLESVFAYLFDGRTGEQLLTIPLGDAGGAGAIEFAGGNLLVGGYMENFLLFSGSTGELLREIPMEQKTLSIDVIGNDFLVGAYSDEDLVRKVSVLDGETGDELLVISDPTQQPTGAYSYGFGYSVSSFGDDILVGAPNREVNGLDDAGCVYLFDGATGELKLTIPNPTPVRDEEFGLAVVGLNGHIAVALGQDTGVRTIELFDATSGEYVMSIPNPGTGGLGGRHAGDGMMAAMNGNLLVGAINAGVGEIGNAGAVYLFECFPEPLQPGDTNADGVVNLEDLNNVRNNFGASGLGDTNADGVVDLEDLNNVRNHFGEATNARSVPEPGGIALVALVLLGGVAFIRFIPRQSA